MSSSCCRADARGRRVLAEARARAAEASGPPRRSGFAGAPAGAHATNAPMVAAGGAREHVAAPSLRRADRSTDRSGERAQALVETALVMPLLLLLLVGLFDVGRAIWLSNTLATAVREGTRYGVVHGALSGSPTGPGSPTYTPPDADTAITAQVQRYAIGVPNMTVRSTWPDGDANRGSRVVVSASFPFTPILAQAFLGSGLQVTLQSSSSLVIEQ